jgi:capsid protein
VKSKTSNRKPKGFVRQLADIPSEPSVQRVSGIPQARAALDWGYGPSNGYGMAVSSSARGYIYFPELDTRREVTAYTRGEGLRKARYLDANVGLVRRLLNGMGRLAMGTGLMPRFTTADKEWNKLMNARLEAALGSALTYDLAGRRDFYSAQADDMTTAYRDGDLGKVYARDEAGNLRTARYEGHQIGRPSLAASAETAARIFDGVRVDRHNRNLGFFIQSGDQAGEAVEIPAADFALLCNYERKGAPRGITILKHAINKLVDRGELEQMTSKGMKNAARVGYAITREPGAPPKAPGWSGRGPTGVNPTRTESTTDAAGNTRKVKVEDVIDNTGGEIPELPEGFDIKMLLDQRPHPNTVEFFDYLARDAAMGCDWPHDLLYSIWKLGGANTRYVMADAQSVIEREQQRYIDLFGARDVVAFAAEELRTGRVRKCLDPEWWKHEFIPPARMTVDFGRDGALHLEQLKCGALTYKRFLGWQGLSLSQLDEWLEEVAHVRAQALLNGLDPDWAVSQIYSRPGLPAVAEPPTAAAS